MPIEDSLQAARTELPKLAEPKAQGELPQIMAARDRLAGILTVARELRMPQFLAFGSANLPSGDCLTDYDRARTFILKQRPEQGAPVPGSFYPEVLNLHAGDRILALARSHVRCTPAKERQVNLFSLNGRYNYTTARKTTEPGGTTCALFARAILIAAGDPRFTEPMLGKLGQPPHMIHSMGLQYTNFKTSGDGWVSLDKGPAAQLAPAPGDVYFIRIMSGKEDSGHIGFVEAATRTNEAEMKWTTIDGGQKAGHSKGHWTTRNDRTFKKNGSHSFPWMLQGGQYTINGEQRKLLGWVCLGDIIP